MKLIVAGATGLVGSEIIQQCLRKPSVTSVIALARRPVHINTAPGATSKVKSVVVRDYAEYPDHVKAEFMGADACIWTVAVTPFLAGNYDFAEVERVCMDCTIAGFEAMWAAHPAPNFRFLYLSAEGTPRDLSKKPMLWGEYQLMRGKVEHTVLGLPAKHPGLQVSIAQPGFVTTDSASWQRAVLARVFGALTFLTGAKPNIDRGELAAAAMKQAIAGFEKETLLNVDLVRIGRAALLEI